jgi:hypothetical protein
MNLAKQLPISYPRSRRIKHPSSNDSACTRVNEFVYVPFNEPDNIWYNKTNLENQFFRDWKTVFQQIRSQQPNARIAGSNIANFDAVYISNFLTYCKANACLPDVMTWHELNSGFYSNWSQHYASYRSMETNLSIGPLPINIDEYST